MRHILRNSIFAVGLLVLAVASFVPPEDKLRRGKDLSGGTTLVYSVQMDPGQNAQEVLGKTIEVLKDRVDPSGLLEIQMIAQGQDRIEVTMPLPNSDVLALSDAFQKELEELDRATIDADQWERAMRAGDADRAAQLESLSRGDAALLEDMRETASLFDDASYLRQTFDAAAESGAAQPVVLDELAGEVATAEIKYELAREEVLAAGLSSEEMRRVLQLSDVRRPLKNEAGEFAPYDSESERALTRIQADYPAQWPQVERVRKTYEAYIEQRTSLDDPDELKRLIAAAGVPSFRITIDPQGSGTENSHPEEARLRAELLEKGPLNVQARDARWCKVNKLSTWYDSIEGLNFLESDPAGFWRSRGLVGERYQGEHWLLCWDNRVNRLTQNDNDWRVARAFQTQDEFGRPAIGFAMDERGAIQLGRLTSPNVGNKLAVLLDEEVYTAPVLNAALSRNGIIQGDFSTEELNYIIRVMTAGSLQAALSPEPLSVNEIAPTFGQDNLEAGTYAGMIAIGAVSGFMLFYYFSFGLVAVISLVFNAALILGAMSLARAAFTLPGIAGVILTFGMAVDANVLIYERIREERRNGADLRTAVRLGFRKALSSIVDGNVTNLIVCFVLANLGTQEIKGFAITLGIGVVGTMISSLFISRLILSLAVDVLKLKNLGMLPSAVPAIERLLEPKFDWMAARWGFVVVSLTGIGLGIGMIVYQGDKMLDTEFRGGTQVTVRFEKENEDGTRNPVQLLRADVLDRVQGLAEGLDETDPLEPLKNAEVIPQNADDTGVRSSEFQIKTYATDQSAVIEAISAEFAESLASRPPLNFIGRDEPTPPRDRVGPILGSRLGEAINQPGVRNDVSEYIGGVAILLEDLQPRPDRDGLLERLANAREKAEFSGTVGRSYDLVVLAGTDEAIESAAFIVVDEGLSALGNEELWEDEVAQIEWELVQVALRNTTRLASVQSFSPVIAETFQQTAIVSVVLSLLLILIYIWVRFGSVRYSTAAIITLLHDVLIMIGLIALAEILYENDMTAGIAQSVGVQPFKIDLNLVAAILTIIGYSLNDTIIIMDRIRENRGKLPYASREVINQSINQTISRTVITSGTTFIATLILYVFGGEGVRAFSYALLAGVAVGTYSSIAVAAPLVWSRKTSGPSDRVVGSEDGAHRLP
ncbi:MAG: protein translocase subunit SecD [Planctomycetota bacterium]